MPRPTTTLTTHLYNWYLRLTTLPQIEYLLTVYGTIAEILAVAVNDLYQKHQNPTTKETKE